MFALTPLEQEALTLSLSVAFWAVIISLPLAVALAWVLARLNFWGKIVLDGFIHLPLVVPPVVVGYFLLVVLGRNGVIGHWLYDTFGLTFAFNWKGAAVAAGVMGFPLFVRAIRLSIEAMDPRLEAAARTLGATPLRVFWSVTVPLMTPGLIAGALLAFARALGEFGATITFVANIPGQTRTLPIAIYTVLQSPGGDAAVLRMVLLATLLAILALVASEVLARQVRKRIHGAFKWGPRLTSWMSPWLNPIATLNSILAFNSTADSLHFLAPPAPVRLLWSMRLRVLQLRTRA